MAHLIRAPARLHERLAQRECRVSLIEKIQRKALVPYPIATIHPDILGGTPTFNGTRVPVAVLFENLADGLSLNQILDAYPTIHREVAVRALAFGQHALMESAKPRPSTALLAAAKPI